jgi:hypothetical protein
MAVSGNVAGTAKRAVSYAPNQALIKGQRDVAQAEAAADVAGGIAFAENFTGAIVKGIQEQEKRDAIREAYLDDLPNPQNMRKIEDGYNKKAITEFLNKNKDEYNKAVDCYTRTKDRGCKEQIEDIKFRFSNLNTQLDLYLNDKKSYLDAFGNKQLVDLPGDEKYTELYTNKGAFSIEENGDLGFTINNEYNKYNDIVGKWNVNNNIYDTHILKSSFNAKLNGQKGLEFNRDIERNSTAAVLKTTGPEGVMTATRSDFGFDDDYILPRTKQRAGKLTFEHMFANGMLADKYYDGSLTGVTYGKKREDGKGWDLGEDGAKWFWDKNNSKNLTNLLAEYSTDVNQSMHEQGLQSFNVKKSQAVSNQPYMQESRSKANKINSIASKGKNVTLEDLQSIAINPTLSREIKKLANGTFQVIDSQNQETIIDPNNIEGMRNILYNLAQVRDVHRISKVSNEFAK